MWTIFLDRDGVINRNPPQGDYVKCCKEFQFLPGVLTAIARLTKAGFRLLVITNQACISKGLVSWATVHEIHALMMQEVDRARGHIEAVLCCPHLEGAGCDCRKPAPGLILRAREEYGVDLGRAIMVGDSLRDVQTGAAVGVPTIMVFSGLGRLADLGSEPLPCWVADDLAHASQLILDGEILTPYEPLQIQDAIRK